MYPGEGHGGADAIANEKEQVALPLRASDDKEVCYNNPEKDAVRCGRQPVAVGGGPERELKRGVAGQGRQHAHGKGSEGQEEGHSLRHVDTECRKSEDGGGLHARSAADEPRRFVAAENTVRARPQSSFIRNYAVVGDFSNIDCKHA